MTRLAFFGELARIQIELKAESFEANNDAEPVIPADRLRRPLNFNVKPLGIEVSTCFPYTKQLNKWMKKC